MFDRFVMSRVRRLRQRHAHARGRAGGHATTTPHEQPYGEERELPPDPAHHRRPRRALDSASRAAATKAANRLSTPASESAWVVPLALRCGGRHLQRVIAALDDQQRRRRGHARAHGGELVERAQRIAAALHEQDRRAQRDQDLVAHRARRARLQRIAQADDAGDLSSSATWQPTRPPIDLPIRNSGPFARARGRRQRGAVRGDQRGQRSGVLRPARMYG